MSVPQSGKATVKDAVNSIAEVLELWTKVPDEVKAIRDTLDVFNITEGGHLFGKHNTICYSSLTLKELKLVVN